MRLLKTLLDLQNSLPLLTFVMFDMNQSANLSLPSGHLCTVYMYSSDVATDYHVAFNTEIEGKYILTKYYASTDDELRAIITYLYQKNVKNSEKSPFEFFCASKKLFGTVMNSLQSVNFTF